LSEATATKLVGAGLALVTLAACGAPASAPGTAPPSASIAVVVMDFRLDPVLVTAETGNVLAVRNAGPTPHNLTVRAASSEVLSATRDLRTDETATLPVVAAAGSYVLYCSLPGHESLGMKGTLTVKN
jgi:plastocyanin